MPLSRPTTVFAGISTVVLRRANEESNTKMGLPLIMQTLSLEACVSHIVTIRETNTDSGQTRILGMATIKKGICQRLILGGGRPKAPPGDDSGSSDTGEQMKTLEPAQTRAESFVDVLGEPTDSSSSAPSCGDATTVKYLVGGYSQIIGSGEKLSQVQSKAASDALLVALQSVELRPVREPRKEMAQVLMSETEEITLAMKAGELSESGESNDLTSGKRRLMSG